jgi:Protein of unknown function (DUF3108)
MEVDPGGLARWVVGGKLSYRSQGEVGLNGPETRRYTEKTGGRPERWLEFVGNPVMMKSHQVAALSVPPGAQDRLSVMWLLSMLARSNPGLLEKGTTFSVPMFTFRQVYPAYFENFGPTVLVTPAGVLQCLHVSYKTQEKDSDKVDIWLGYDYDMQPVRIRWQEARGRIVDLVLNKKP